MSAGVAAVLALAAGLAIIAGIVKGILWLSGTDHPWFTS